MIYMPTGIKYRGILQNMFCFTIFHISLLALVATDLRQHQKHFQRHLRMYKDKNNRGFKIHTPIQIIFKDPAFGKFMTHIYVWFLSNVHRQTGPIVKSLPLLCFETNKHSRVTYFLKSN